MRALLLIDIQNDFLPAGALAVPNGDAVVPVANALMSRFGLVVATQDWHPADHASFSSQHPGRQPGDVIELGGGPQILWPDHCVQNTSGAALAPALDVSRIDHVVRKGTDREIDSYSGFFDNDHKKGTGLADLLRGHGVTEIVAVGLATDYCVKFTVLDGLELGFVVNVVREGVRSVDLQAGDGDAALAQMAAAGARVIACADVLPPG